MSDPRNVAHAKKVTQEKKHQASGDEPADTVVAQPGKKAAAKKKRGPAGAATEPGVPAVNETAVAPEPSPATPSAEVEGSLAVLAKLKDMEFHSRANLERLAELTMTVEDELKQQEMSGPLGDVFSAQNALQTKLTALIEAYKTACDRMQG